MIAAVIVNFGSPDNTLACLSSLAESNGVGMVALVVDNNLDPHSRDALARLLEQTYGSAQCLVGGWRVYGSKGSLGRALLYTSATNAGYGAASNAGLRKAAALGAEYVWFLNNDVTVSKCAPQILESFMRTHPMVAAVGPTIMTAPPKQAVECIGGARLGFWTLRCRFARQPSARIDYISGAALFVRTGAAAALGGFPEDHFLFFEEVDLCARMRRVGFDIAAVPEATVTHYGGVTSGSRGGARRKSPLAVYYSARNAVWFARSYRPRLLLVSVVATRAAFALCLLPIAPRNAIATLRGLRAGIAPRVVDASPSA